MSLVDTLFSLGCWPSSLRSLPLPMTHPSHFSSRPFPVLTLPASDLQFPSTFLKQRSSPQLLTMPWGEVIVKRGASPFPPKKLHVKTQSHLACVSPTILLQRESSYSLFQFQQGFFSHQIQPAFAENNIQNELLKTTFKVGF